MELAFWVLNANIHKILKWISVGKKIYAKIFFILFILILSDNYIEPKKNHPSTPEVYSRSSTINLPNNNAQAYLMSLKYSPRSILIPKKLKCPLFHPLWLSFTSVSKGMHTLWMNIEPRLCFRDEKNIICVLFLSLIYRPGSFVSSI